MGLLDFMAPPKHKPELSKEEMISNVYGNMRLKVFLGIYLGYAAYYLVRKNLSFATNGMIEDGLIDKTWAGVAMAGIPVAYAVSKFLMGSLSDRSDARKFMTIGLILSALVMIVAGVIPYPGLEWSNNFMLTAGIMFFLMFLVGWLSGMGWPPCGRVMSHWFSTNERSFKMSIWNTAHNIGNGSLGLIIPAGVILFSTFGIDQTWRAAFIAPSIIALLFAALCWWLIRDTPESCGLPAIEDYRKDYSGAKAKKGEEDKIPFKTLFVDYILKNPALWLIGFANIFVYFIRYGIADWSPIYLQEVCNMSDTDSSFAYTIREYAGIIGTVLCGWLSTKFFQGRCAPVNVIYMILVVIGVLAYWQAIPLAEMLAIDVKYIIYVSLALIGGAIYGPVAMISIQAISIVPKNAAGTAAGFMGLLGYLIGDAILSKIAFGYVADSSLGWNFTFLCFLTTGVLTALICAISWGKEKKMFKERIAAAQNK